MRADVLLCTLFLAPVASAAEGFAVGQKVPEFTLKALNVDAAGTSHVTVGHYFGDKPKAPKKATLISFFATYCEPCKRELPFLAALHETYRDKGLQVLLVSIDQEADKIDVAKDLARKHALRFPVLSDRFNLVARRYHVEKLPCVYIVGGDGRVVVNHVGYEGNVGESVFNTVRKLLGEPLSDPVPGPLQAHVAGPTARE